MTTRNLSAHLTLLGLLATTSLLVACGSSPPVRFFSLEPLPVDYPHDVEDAIVLGVGPLRLADYLKRSQMITRGVDAEILVDERARWAEPLGSAIQRIVAMNVDGLLDTVAVVGFPDTDTAELDYRVVGRVQRFDVDQAGRAVLQVQWRVEDAEGMTVRPPRRDRYAVDVPNPESPATQAAALGSLLGQFSRDLANAARTLTPAAPGNDGA